MLCCSDYCPKYKECALACINVEYKNRLDQVENLYTYGSCSIQYVDGEVKMKENYMCGPTSNYAMFVSIIPEYDKVFRKFKDLNKYHQVTMDEWIKEKEKQDKEKAKINDNIDMRVKDIPNATEAEVKYRWQIDIEDLQRQMKEVKKALQRLEVNMSNGHSDLVETTQM